MCATVFALVVLAASFAHAECAFERGASNTGEPLNQLVLDAAATLLPEDRRPFERGFEPAVTEAIEAGRIADERGRERLVSALVLASAFLHTAGRDNDAAAALRRLVAILDAYDGAEDDETRRDNASDLIAVGDLFASYGLVADAREIARRITNHRADFESRVGIYPTARGLIEIHATSGDEASARAELEGLKDSILATYSQPGDMSWAMTALVSTALSFGMTDDARAYLDLGQTSVAAIDDVATRHEREALYRRLEEVLSAMEGGESPDAYAKQQMRAALPPFEERLAAAVVETPALSRADALGRLLDALDDDETVQRKAALAHIREDAGLPSDPLSALRLVESLTRSGAFGAAADLLNRTCAKPVPVTLQPALALANAFVASETAIAAGEGAEMFGVEGLVPLLAAGLDIGPPGGFVRGIDPLPELSQK
ncbi:MAG: hypothetical protein C0606_01790 [Hyphomicrobiales bacterium]|nr:MAG: hypothetical protein C0606_01790 [Hyphomicrobiales bacterium]